MTDTEKAKEIRKKLKQIGYNNRQVGVKRDGCAIYVTMKDLTVDVIAIEKIALEYEYYTTCRATGEILGGGGNTFVFVEYDRAVTQALCEPGSKLTQKVREAISNPNTRFSYNGISYCFLIDVVTREKFLTVRIGDKDGRAITLFRSEKEDLIAEASGRFVDALDVMKKLQLIA